MNIVSVKDSYRVHRIDEDFWQSLRSNKSVQMIMQGASRESLLVQVLRAACSLLPASGPMQLHRLPVLGTDSQP